MSRGRYVHKIRFEAPGVPVPDGEGGWTQGWTPIANPESWAEIVPASVRDLERQTAGTVSATASHVVTCDYHPGVTIKSRIVKLDDGRQYYIAGGVNYDERNITMSLFCREALTPGVNSLAESAAEPGGVTDG